MKFLLDSLNEQTKYWNRRKRMAEEKMQENREEIIKISGELKLINQKLDNHINHMSMKIDTIYKIIWTVSFMVLGQILWVVRDIIIG